MSDPQSIEHPVYRLQRGDAPLLVSIPHLGTGIPAELAGRLGPHAAPLADTDWHLDRLYGFARELGATVLGARISRYAIDLNRPPGGESLYPGQATTGLCPTETFRGEPLYPPGGEPGDAERQRRLQAYWQPYHAALRAELDRLRAIHPRVVLYDAHSIRSRIPRLFEGELPQFNLGTNGGATCDQTLESALAQVCEKSGHSWIANGRFKGGWTTRHYGKPASGIHAVQMELAQRGYMDEPAAIDETNWPGQLHAAPAILPTLQALIAACLTFAEGKTA